jgi:chromosome segregation ATPase
MPPFQQIATMISSKRYLEAFQRSFGYYLSESGSYRTKLGTERASEHVESIKALVSQGHLQVYGLDRDTRQELLAKHPSKSAAIRAYACYLKWMRSEHEREYHRFSEVFVSDILGRLCHQFARQEQNLDSIQRSVEEVRAATRSTDRRMAGLSRDLSTLTDRVNERFETTDSRLDGMEERLELVLENQREMLAEIRRAREATEQVSTKVDQHREETRVNYEELRRALTRTPSRYRNPPPSVQRFHSASSRVT